MKNTIWLGILLACMLGACASQPLPAATMPPATAAPAQPLTAMPTFMPELTYDEARAGIPPAPVNLRARAEGRAVRITWEPAPPVQTPHDYSDQPLYYKVFRRAVAQADPVLVGTATSTSFLDANVVAGDKYYYSVVAVHRNLGGGEVDGASSDEVFWGG